MKSLCTNKRSNVWSYAIVVVLKAFLGVVFLLFLLSSCESRERRLCLLDISWRNAPLDFVSDSLSFPAESAGVPSQLYVSFLNTDRLATCDTVLISERDGRTKLQLAVPTIGESELSIASEQLQLYIPLKALSGRRIAVKIDWETPWLYTAKGFPEADLRSSLIRSLRRPSKALQKARDKGDSTAIAESWDAIYLSAARFIDEHANDKGIDALSRELFAGWRGAKRYVSMLEVDTVAQVLEYLHTNYAYYRQAMQREMLIGFPEGFLDTLRSNVVDTTRLPSTLFLVEMVKEKLPTELEVRQERLYQSKLLADSLSHSLYIVTYPIDSLVAPSLLPHPAVADSLAAKSKAKRLRAEAQKIKARRDSLVQIEEQKPISERKRYHELKADVDTLLSQALVAETMCREAHRKAQQWENAPRRFVINSSRGGWFRLCELNLIDTIPYYLLFDPDRKLFYRGSSYHKALQISDSLCMGFIEKPRNSDDTMP